MPLVKVWRLALSAVVLENGGMQGREEAQRQLLDVQALAGQLLKPGSVYAFLAEHRSRLFPDQMMQDLFPSKRGRPSIPASVIGSVMVLQVLEGLSDRQVADALTYDLRWKAACGYGLADTAFHPSALTHWRQRLAASNNPHRIMDAVTDIVQATGVLAGKRRRAVDSTILDDAVARQDTITQLIAAVRRFGREVPNGQELLATHATGYDYSRTGKPDIAWDDAQAKDDLISALVTDALALLGAVDPQQWEQDSKQYQAYGLLALVAGQDVEPAEGSDGTDGRWKIARKVAADRMISTVDPEARHARKTRSDQRDGFKAHVVVEPETGLITNAEVTAAAGPLAPDAVVAASLLATDPSVGQQPVSVLGDSAYATGALLRRLADAGHTALLKPHPLARAVPGGFTLDDFVYDRQANTLTCPSGLVRPIAAKGTVTFGAGCQGCLLRAQCTTARSGRKITLHPQHELLSEHRVRAQSPQFQDEYRHQRPMVERSLAWMTRGARRVPFRGVSKNDWWWKMRAAGINLKRMLVLGLARQQGAWTIG